MDIKHIKPRQFREVVGQAFTKQVIQTSLTRKSYPQITLLEGPSGTGKSTLAEIISMSLTCEEKNQAEPCLTCRSCKENLTALEKGEAGSNVVKVNISLALGKKDVLEIIKDIFILEPKPNQNSVYILEEVHALSKTDQIPFLEEMSNIPDGVYVIMCTTQSNKLIPELRGRATSLRLKPPTYEECTMLVEQTCARIGVRPPKETAMKMLVQKVGHVPREIVKTILLLSSGLEVNENSIREYLGVVEFKEYLTLFEKTRENMFEYVGHLEKIKDKGISLKDLVAGMKSFMIDTVTYLYGRKNISIDNRSKGRLKDIFSEYNERDFLGVVKVVGDLTYETEEESFYQLIMLKRHMNKETEREVLKKSRAEANKTAIQSERKLEERKIEEQKKEKDNRVKNEEVSLEYIQELTGNLTVSKDK